MNLVNHKNGKLTKEGDFFYLEKHYNSYWSLQEDEYAMQVKIEDNSFLVVDSVVFICDNPFYNLDKLYKKKPRKIFFKHKFKLMHLIE